MEIDPFAGADEETRYNSIFLLALASSQYLRLPSEEDMEPRGDLVGASRPHLSPVLYFLKSLTDRSILLEDQINNILKGIKYRRGSGRAEDGKHWT